MFEMDITKVVGEIENIKHFNVSICDAYLKNNIVYIPEPETLDPLFFEAAVKGKPKSFLILTGKN